MAVAKPITQGFSNFLAEQAKIDILRFVTCGSVDHGKSTLIGRLLYDSHLVFEDQLRALEAETNTADIFSGSLDYARLLDGLEAEAEQGITIDVAYRYFAANGRRFIVADAPGHEQYTRNMATAASTSDLALIVVDAGAGLLTQTKRHSYIFALFGISSVVLAVNKMDLVDYDEARFTTVANAYREIAKGLGLQHVQCIPVSALNGDNIAIRSTRMEWYRGPTLIEHLSMINVAAEVEALPFRLPVQSVVRAGGSFRGYSGRITSGTIRIGDSIVVQPSGQISQLARIIGPQGDIDHAIAGQSVTVVLGHDVDVGRGTLICAGAPPFVANQYAAHLLWMDEAELFPGRQYLVRSGTQLARATVSKLKHRVNFNTFESQAATSLRLNEIGSIDLSIDRPMVLDPYRPFRNSGAFILIDPFSNRTAGAGVIQFALRRATNVQWQKLEVSRSTRAGLNQQRPCVLWFTGLSGAGKSTIANLVEAILVKMGRHTYLLDGDNVRHGLNRDLGFTAEARVENVRRVAEVARLFVDAGLIILVSLISPFRAEREMARGLLDTGDFIEIHIATPLEVCERRDPKGLYRRARAGQIPNFTGIDSPYESPESAELVLDTTLLSAEAAAEEIIGFLQQRAYI